MAPSAPALLSITIDWPSACESGLTITRAVRSAAPEGGNGTTRRIGFDGYWASAPCMKSESASAKRQASLCIVVSSFAASLRQAVYERCDGGQRLVGPLAERTVAAAVQLDELA